MSPAPVLSTEIQARIDSAGIDAQRSLADGPAQTQGECVGKWWDMTIPEVVNAHVACYAMGVSPLWMENS